ncbi:hypothetical protein BH11MYX3_BH11MYX3_37480 [soil metagenome]
MAPRPSPVEPTANPVPGAPDPLEPGRPGPTFPTPDANPGAPTPLPEPVTMREVPSPDYRASATVMQAPPPRTDAGVSDTRAADSAIGSDANPLPPVRDAMPTDAAKTLQP